MAESVRIAQRILQAMLAEARRTPETECCGLLAGRDGVITTLLPARNAAPNPATEYEIDPRELFELFRRMRRERLEHLGIYHSHPRGANVPSPTDVARAYYPQTPYFIVSPAVHLTRAVRAFRIAEGRFTELEVVVEPE
jgi:proteasome lid subunit RPN8/RPN11